MSQRIEGWGPENIREEYWHITAAANDVLQAWDAQQQDADGDWGQMIGAIERLRTAIFGQDSQK